MQNKPNQNQTKTNKTDLYLLVDQQRPAFSASAAKLHPNPNCETLLKLDQQQQQQQQQPAPAADSSEAAGAAAVEGGVASETASAAPAVTPPPLSVAVEVTVPSTPGTGCNCFGSKLKGKGKKRWTSSTDTPEMSEVYCPSCEDAANETPACLSKMPDKRQTRLKPKPPSILCVESELVVSGKRGSLRLGEQKRSSNSKGGNNITRSVSLSAADRRTSVPIPVLPKKTAAAPVRVRLIKKEQDKAKDKDKEKDKENDKKSSNQKGNLLSRMSPKRLRNAKASEKEKDKPKEKSKVPVKTKIAQSCSLNGNSNNNNNAKAARTAPKALSEEYEIADDATSLNGEAGVELGELGAGGGAAKMAILSESDSKLMISVRGREELPVVEQTTTTTSASSPSPSPSTAGMQCFVKCLRVPVKSESHPLQLDQPDQADNATNDNNQHEEEEEEENVELGATAAVTPLLNGAADVANGNQPATANSSSATLPRTSKQSYYNKVLHLVPKRRTPDGTNIYYWCDLPKKALKGYKSILIHKCLLPQTLWLSLFCMQLL